MKIDAARLRHLISAMEKEGCDRETVNKILIRCGISRRDAEQAKLFDYETEARIVREACDALGDITFGAKAGLCWKVSNSVTGYISKYSKDLRAAIENTSRFHEIIDPAVFYALKLSSNAASFEVSWKDAGYSKYHRHTEFLLFGVLSRMRHITQSAFYPIELRFDHEVRNSAREFEKLAGFPVVFGAESLEIILSHSTLDLPIPTYDLRLREHLTEYGDRLLAERPRNKMALRSQVEGLLTKSLPSKMLSANDVASSLGMSASTFARRLKDDGTSFRTIVDELRFDLSKTLMKDGMTLSEISFALGYADQAAFSTAFKRWTGTAPRDFNVTPHSRIQV